MDFTKRAGYRTKHHIRAKSRKRRKLSKGDPRNLIMLDANRHAAFHLLFGLMDFQQAANVLLRAYQMKGKSNV